MTFIRPDRYPDDEDHTPARILMCVWVPIAIFAVILFLVSLLGNAIGG